MDFYSKVFKIIRYVVDILTCEWVLTKWRIPNGGAVVFFRAYLSSIIIFLLVLVFINILDPLRSWEFSFFEFKKQTTDMVPWFGAIFAGIYTALYARFSSQWSYLAGLYNNIKQAELNIDVKSELASWKAGFLEDAENLHMAGKGTFVTIIHTWGDDELVKEYFIKYAPGGEERFNKLMKKVKLSYKIVQDKYSK